ncbi:MAG: hypothetical protein RIQ60_4140 [Pseudomonadota bacterium]|jgi:DNA-binding PadR family transcriptional regulator
MQDDLISGPAILGIAILVLFVMGTMKSARLNKAAEEKSKADAQSRQLEKQQEIDDELLFVKDVLAAAAPSIDGLRRLKERYGWAEIVGTHDLSRNHLKLLRQCSVEGDDIELPNLEITNFGPDERRVAREAKRVAEPLFDPYDPWSTVQEPTVQTLRELQRDGFVLVSPEPGNNRREFFVRLTPRGSRMVEADYALKDRNDGLPGAIKLPKSNDAKKNIAAILRRYLGEV